MLRVQVTRLVTSLKTVNRVSISMITVDCKQHSYNLSMLFTINLNSVSVSDSNSDHTDN